MLRLRGSRLVDRHSSHPSFLCSGLSMHTFVSRGQTPCVRITEHDCATFHIFLCLRLCVLMGFWFGHCGVSEATTGHESSRPRPVPGLAPVCPAGRLSSVAIMDALHALDMLESGASPDVKRKATDADGSESIFGDSPAENVKKRRSFRYLRSSAGSSNTSVMEALVETDGTGSGSPNDPATKKSEDCLGWAGQRPRPFVYAAHRAHCLGLSIRTRRVVP